MVWNPNQTAAQNLQFQQIPFEDVAKVFASSSVEMNMFMSAGRMVFREIETNGRPLRVDVQTGSVSYLAARFGEEPWLPGSDPDTAVRDQVPTPSVEQMLFYGHELYMQYMYRDTAKQAVKSKAGGYSNLKEFLLTDAAEGFKNRMALKIAGTANGYIAKLKSAGTGGGGYRDIAVEWAGEDGPFAGANMLLQGGFAVDAVDPATGSLRTGPSARGRWINMGGVARDVGSNAAGVAVTLDSGHGGVWQAGDLLVLYKERPDTLPSTQAAYRELPGFLGLLDVIGDQSDLPWYGDLQRSSYAFTEALVFDNSGTLRALTLELINYCADQFTQLTGKQVSQVYCRPAQQRKFAEFINVTAASGLAGNSPMRWDANARTANAGVTGVDISIMGGMTVKQFSSKNCPTHTMFFINPSELGLVMDKGPVNMDPGGDIRTPGKPTYQGARSIRGIGLMSRWCTGAGFRLDDLIGSHVQQ